MCKKQQSLKFYLWFQFLGSVPTNMNTNQNSWSLGEKLTFSISPNIVKTYSPKLKWKTDVFTLTGRKKSHLFFCDWLLLAVLDQSAQPISKIPMTGLPTSSAFSVCALYPLSIWDSFAFPRLAWLHETRLVSQDSPSFSGLFSFLELVEFFQVLFSFSGLLSFLKHDLFLETSVSKDSFGSSRIVRFPRTRSVSLAYSLSQDSFYFPRLVWSHQTYLVSQDSLAVSGLLSSSVFKDSFGFSGLVPFLETR